MLGILLVLFLVLSVLAWRLHGAGWRDAALLAAIGFGLLVAAFTEALSAFSAISLGWVAALWAACSLVLGLIVAERIRRRRPITCPEATRVHGGEMLMLLGILAIALVTAVVALAAPPTNWDSMTYHLPRVLHWLQDRNVGFYPTAIPRQLHQNPWAEYAIMHLQLLSGGDRFAAFVQWFAMIGSVIGVSLIAQDLGGDERAQLLSALVAATIPMGILQASSTQNDYVVAFWLISFVHFSLLYRKQPDAVHSLAVGSSLGLAILAKATAYVFGFPFALWVGMSSLRKLGLQSWKSLAIIAAVVVLVNTGHAARNYGLYGHPLGPGLGPDYDYTNDVVSISAVASNLLRNAALHFGTPSGHVNAAVQQAVELVHGIIGIDASDPRTTYHRLQFSVPRLALDEDSTGSPVHFVLILAAIAAAVFWPKLRGSAPVLGYALAVASGFVLFCLILKWQPWHSRLQLPFFALASPLVGVVLPRTAGRRAMYAIAAGLLVVALPYLLMNATRPLIGSRSVVVNGRRKQVMMRRPDVMNAYVDAADFLRSEQACSQVGLILGGDDWEYPLWPLLNEVNPGVRIEHVNVTNSSAALATPFTPCFVISTVRSDDAELMIGSTRYERVWSWKGSVQTSVYRAVDGAGSGSGGM